jgi:hypothetical protein
MASFFAASGMAAYVFGRNGLWWIASAFAAFVFWRLFDQGFGQHEIYSDVDSVTSIFAVTILGLGWATIVRWLPVRRGLTFLCVLAPSLILVLWTFEDQRIPSAMCTTDGISVHVARTPTFVPWGLSARMNWDKHGTHLSYSADRNDKPFVKSVCAETDDGMSPIFASSLDISPVESIEICARSPSLPSCEYATQALRDLEIVSVTVAGKGRLMSDVSWLGRAMPDYALFAGDVRSGHLCFEAVSDFDVTHCRLWRPFGHKQTLTLEAQAKSDSDELIQHMLTKVGPLKAMMRVEGF